MNPLALHEFHQTLGARFGELNEAELVTDHGDWATEYAALRDTVGVLDFSFRSRLCLTGADRARFLHGQVTNAVKELRPGQGCYAALVTAKGKMESDLNIFNLADELLLDFEPGLAAAVQQRLERFVVADDVQVVDAAPHYGLLTVQGPQAEGVVRALGLFAELPTAPLGFVKMADGTLGEMYLMNQPRLYTRGFDVFAPVAALGAVADKLIAGAKQMNGRACGWRSFEVARIEAGIPRFGADMDETNIPLESGIEARAVSYKKGCYVGQEVINRIHSIGHVNKELRRLKLADDLKTLPTKGEKLFKDGKDAGYVTSATTTPGGQANLALGYVRREFLAVGTELMLGAGDQQTKVQVADVPG